MTKVIVAKLCIIMKFSIFYVSEKVFVLIVNKIIFIIKFCFTKIISSLMSKN